MKNVETPLESITSLVIRELKNCLLYASECGCENQEIILGEPCTDCPVNGGNLVDAVNDKVEALTARLAVLKQKQKKIGDGE